MRWIIHTIVLLALSKVQYCRLNQPSYSDANEFASYVSSAKSLDCDLESECMWRNAPSDGLLDTSDFWYFKVRSATIRFAVED